MSVHPTKPIAMLGLLLLLISACYSNDLSISLSIPKQDNDRIMSLASYESKVFALLKNESSKVLDVWSPKFSHGYDGYSYEVKDSSGEVFEISRRDKNWRYNPASILTLDPDETAPVGLGMKVADWEGHEKLKEGRNQVKVRVVFKSDSDEFFIKNVKVTNFWEGEIKSEWVDCVIFYDAPEPEVINHKEPASKKNVEPEKAHGLPEEFFPKELK